MCFYPCLEERRNFTLRKVGGCPFALVNFMMNFYNVGFSVCHSFRSLSQCGRVKDFKGCFQVFDRCSPRQQNSHAAMLFTMRKGKNFSFVSSIWGKEKALKANIEPLLEKIFWRKFFISDFVKLSVKRVYHSK